MTTTILDARDQKILAGCIAARNKLDGPQVGDFVYFASGQLERISYSWPTNVQTSPVGSIHLFDFGGASFSGGMNPGTPRGKLKPTTATLPGKFWFFHHGLAGARRGVDFEIPCQVFITSAKYEGFMQPANDSQRMLELKADLLRQLAQQRTGVQQTTDKGVACNA